jgi:transcriptional regulator with XRE-family HTH domain
MTADASALLGISEYALEAIEGGEMEVPLSVLRKAVEAYQVIYEYILGIEQGSDVALATLFQEIDLILLCQEIYKRPELLKIYSLIRGLGEKDVGRLLRVIDCLVNEL